MEDDAAKQPAQAGPPPPSSPAAPAPPADDDEGAEREPGPVATDSGPDPEAVPARLGRREGRAPRDMIISLVVLLVPIALLLAFYRGVLGGDSPVTVDATDTIKQAQAAAVFPVAVPGDLGDDWHTTSATWRNAADGATLRLGYVAPDDDSALVVQSNITPDKLLPAELGDQAKPLGTVRVGNAAWRSYLARPNEMALVLSDQSRTIIVTGNADPKHLEKLAASLS